jgi:hypothetical protein
VGNAFLLFSFNLRVLKLVTINGDAFKYNKIHKVKNERIEYPTFTGTLFNKLGTIHQDMLTYRQQVMTG